jgi:hypothetical protein
MEQDIRDNKDNLIIGMLIQIQADVQATRDTIMGIMNFQFKFTDQQVELFESLYKQRLADCQTAIIGDIKANYISKNESVNDLLDKIFPRA